MAFSKSKHSGSLGSLSTVIDYNYNVYTATLGLFNIPNAFVDGAVTSQGKFGLLGIGPRHNQNTAWNGQYGMYTSSGTGALTINIETYEERNTIKSLDTCNLKFSIFNSSTEDMCFDLDDTNKRISTSVSSGNTTSALLSGENNKGYIVTSGGNKFLVVGISSTNVNSYPLDASNNIIAGTVNTLNIGVDTNPVGVIRVIGAKNQFVWCIGTARNGSNQNIHMNVILLSVSSSGVFTSVDSDVILSYGSGFSPNGTCAGSYVKNNTIHVVGSCESVGVVYATVDMTSTASNSITIVSTTTGVQLIGGSASGYLAVGYDGTNAICTSYQTGTIITLNGSGLIDTGIVPISLNAIRYRNTQTKFSTATNNMYATGNTFYYNTNRFLCNDVDIGKKVIFAYLMTGTNEEDDVTALAKCVGSFALGNADGLTFTINGTTYGDSIIGNLGSFVINIPILTAVRKLLFTLSITNSLAKTLKAGFGITGGTYNVPTGGNGTFGGDATNGTTLTGANASTVDITIES